MGRLNLGRASVVFALVLWTGAFMYPMRGESQSAPAASQDQPLPTRLVIDVNSPDKALYRVAVPDLRGAGNLGAQGADVIRNDLRLISLFTVLDSKSFIADLNKEGLNIENAPWSSVGAQGVVKGQLTGSDSSFTLEMRFYEIARGTAPSLTKSYRGGAAQLRGFMHDFANEIVRVLTGKAATFNTRLLYARKLGPGRKDVFVSDYDGFGEGRISLGKGNAMLPSFGASRGIWYSMLNELGSYITNTKNRERAVISSSGLTMGPAVCDGRVFFSSTRDGNSEIYSADLTGGDVKRLTNNAAIDVSPTCGPGGKIAFVSSRHGGPQVFVMSQDGGGAARITYKGPHNQTPAFCPDPSNPLLAFSGRDGGGFDIFTLNMKTGEYKRLTQGQGVNQDPTFSPDCRMIAFSSSRGGVYISNPDGLNQTKVINGTVSTLRWSR